LFVSLIHRLVSSFSTYKYINAELDMQYLHKSINNFEDKMQKLIYVVGKVLQFSKIWEPANLSYIYAHNKSW